MLVKLKYKSCYGTYPNEGECEILSIYKGYSDPIIRTDRSLPKKTQRPSGTILLGLKFYSMVDIFVWLAAAE